MEKKEILQRWYDEVWGHGNLDVIDELFAPETVADGLFPSFGIGREDIRELVLAAATLFEKSQTVITHAIEDDEWLAARIEFTSKRVDNGETITFTGQIMVRFLDGKIIETFNQPDFFALFEQLGQLPADALPICLTGQRLQWK